MTPLDQNNNLQDNPVTLAQRLGIGLNVIISSIALFTILVMVNYLASRHYRSFDWAKESHSQLSPLTVQLLKRLTNDVRVVVFFDASPEKSLYNLTDSLLKEYAQLCPRLKVETLNYVRDPGGAKAFRAQYQIMREKEQDLVLFECQGRTRIVLDSELSEWDMSKVLSGESQEVKRKGFKGEMMFSSAILAVSETRQAKTYFLQGHGEHDPDSEEQLNGFSKFASLLKLKNVQLEPLILSKTNEVPADCQMLVVAGPKDALLVGELEKINKYLTNGGRLFAMLNYTTLGRRTGMEKLLSAWGVLVGNNLVCDPDNTRQQGTDMVLLDFSGHPVVAPLIKRGLYMLLPRTISKIEQKGNAPDAPKVDELALTGKKAFTKSEIRNGVAYANPAIDNKTGPFSVMAAVEKGGIPGVSAEHGTTRIVVVGDSIFLGNQTIDQLGNVDFASLAADWLLDRTYLLGGISPRPITEYTVSMTSKQLSTVRFLLLVGLPGGIIFAGILVWFRRRS